MAMLSLSLSMHINLLLAFSCFALVSLSSFPHQRLKEKTKDSKSTETGSPLSSMRQSVSLPDNSPCSYQMCGTSAQCTHWPLGPALEARRTVWIHALSAVQKDTPSWTFCTSGGSQQPADHPLWSCCCSPCVCVVRRKMLRVDPLPPVALTALPICSCPSSTSVSVKWEIWISTSQLQMIICLEDDLQTWKFQWYSHLRMERRCKIITAISGANSARVRRLIRYQHQELYCFGTLPYF